MSVHVPNRPLVAPFTLCLAFALGAAPGCDDGGDLDAIEDDEVVVDASEPDQGVAEADDFTCDADDQAESHGEALTREELAERLGLADLDALVRRRPVQEAAVGDLAAPMPAPLQVFGTAAPKIYRRVPLTFIRWCDDDGVSNCAPLTRANAQAAIDTADRIHYRSNSSLRFYIDANADFTSTIANTSINHQCDPVNNLASFHTADPDGDGKPDTEADHLMLCPVTYASNVAQLLGSLYENGGVVPVFARAGIGDVKWNANTQTWSPVTISGGNSSCAGHLVNMPGDAGGGTLLGHELGHYFCVPHTFGRQPATVTEFESQIQKHITDGYHEPEEATAIIDALYDGDDPDTFFQNHTYLASYPIGDTPPDPGEKLFKSVHNDECGLLANFVTGILTFASEEYWYLAAPDRRNVMSYFKHCFGSTQFHYFSPNQVARMTAAADGHRDEVIEVTTVAGWENNTDVAIPPRPPTINGTYAWVESKITTTGTGTAARVRIHVDIKHTGGLNIRLVKPDGSWTELQNASLNTNQITGDVKNIFIRESLPRAGEWTLQVASEFGPLPSGDHRIDGWRIEFE